MMLHSWNFFLEFLPATLLLFIGFTKTTHHRVAAVAVLIVASLVFASILGVGDALLIVASAILNYAVAFFWIEARPKADHLSRLALCTGITANIAVLAYFKYLEFVVDNVNLILGSSYQAGSLGLFPVGLSFLTFQQIAFLVDAYRGQIRQYSVPFSHYLLFSCFFPKQVAGPIVRHQEFFPQMATLPRSVNIGAFLEGLTRFIYGYFEKVVMADSLSSYARPVFDAAASGHPLGLIAAWGGVLAFTFQLYFDFAGYTNMALGVARMVGFSLPENFMSPYQAVSVSDFWRRWHMTLSRFLRDYLYIPLGGNRRGFARQVINIMITMILGGLWHGASWTFVMWGALHGLYLGLNHTWRRLGWRCSDRVGWILTFVSVAYAWVWFRSDTAAAAIRLSGVLVGMEGWWSGGIGQALQTLQNPSSGGLSSIAGMGGLLDISMTYGRWTVHPVSVLLSQPSLHLICLTLAAVIIWALPNVQEWLEQRRQRSVEMWSTSTGMLIASAFLVAVLVSLHGTTHTFVYSKF